MRLQMLSFKLFFLPHDSRLAPHAHPQSQTSLGAWWRTAIASARHWSRVRRRSSGPGPWRCCEKQREAECCERAVRRGGRTTEWSGAVGTLKHIVL